MRCIYLVAAATAAWLITEAAFGATVGFTQTQVPDGANPPLQVGIWYPATGTPQPTQIGLFTQTVAPDAKLAGQNLPLVVFSHGNGGNYPGHSDTALALANAGFIVAAVTHTGDNIKDHSRALDVPGRARQLVAVINTLSTAWRPNAVDPARIGAFGFSSGGLTVLIAAGGTPDLSLLDAHCQHHPHYADCQLMRTNAAELKALGSPSAMVFPHATSLKAIVVAAPALGFTFDQKHLAKVTMPVQLWRDADDTILPNPLYAEAVRQALPHEPEYHVVPHAGHFDFLAPCPPQLAAVAASICISEPGFDRTAFHQEFNAQIVAFFTRTLAPAG